MPDTQIQSALPPGPPGTTKAEPGPDGKLQYFDQAGKPLGPAPEPADSNEAPQADPYAEFGGTTAPAPAKAAQSAADPYAEFGGSTAPQKTAPQGAADPYAEFGGKVADTPAEQKPGFFKRLGESVGLPTTKAELEAIRDDMVNPRSLALKSLGPITEVAPAVWDYAKRVAKNIGGDVHEEYEAGRNIAQGGPVGANVAKGAYAITHGAVANLPFVGEPSETLGQDITDENYAGAAGGALGIAAQIALPEAHERISARLAHARELTAAVDSHKAASAVNITAAEELTRATDQATAAKAQADGMAQKEAAGQATRDQTIVAQDNASAAAANVMKAQEKVKRASAARAEAAVKVEQATNKISKPEKPKGASSEDIAASNKEIMETIPPGPGKSAYTPEDINTIRPYLDSYHKTVGGVSEVGDVHDAMDHAQQKIERDVKPYVEEYAKEPLLLTDDKGAPTSVKQKLIEALADNEAVRPGFTEEALAELEKYNTTDPSVAEADALRKQLNTENRAAQNRDRSDVQTLHDSDPKFAARYELNDILRNGIYDRFEQSGVKGIRGKRTDEAAIIRFRNASERQIPKGEVRQRGTADVGSVRALAGRASKTLGGAGGAGLGAAIAGPLGAEAGYFGGRYLGERIGRALAPEDLTRNERITRAMKTTGEGRVPQIDASQALPSNPESFEQPPAVIPPVDPRSGTLLHGELATHFGETLGETPYADLEQQFLEDVATKKKYKVALEPAEKTLLQKINAQKVQEQLNLKKKPASARQPAAREQSLDIAARLAESLKSESTAALEEPLTETEHRTAAEAHRQKMADANTSDRDYIAAHGAAANANTRAADYAQMGHFDAERASQTAREYSDAANALQERGEEAVDHDLHADLATHYNESLANSDPVELENRFMSDLEAKTAQGVELEPAEKTLLSKINKSKASARNAVREATAEAAKEKTETGQVPTTQPPFETEPHRPLPKKFADMGITTDAAARHELGHHFIVDEMGHPVEDIISHEHPDISPSSVAEARWNDDAYRGEDGKLDLNKIKGGLEDILDIFHGGPVAEEVTGGKPVAQNPASNGDLRRMKSWLKKAGFSPIETAQMMKASELRVRQALTTPGVPEILKRYAQFREAGLDPKYLMSQDAIGSAVQEYRNARGGGGNGEGNKPEVSGKAGEGNGASKPGGTGKVPSGSEKEARPAGEAGTGAGAGRRANDLKAEARAGVVEKTTGDEAADKAIKAGGGVPGGVMDFGEFGKVRMMHEPETGTTLGFKDNEPVTPETVKAKIAKSRAEYGLKTEASAATESKTPISDAILAKHPISDDPSQSGFIFPKGEHVALNPAEEHDSMIQKATGGDTGVPNFANREHLIQNEGVVRVRARKGPGGDELALSIPSTGVTEEQIQQMRRAVGKQGRYGNVVMETGAGKSLPVKEFARPSDIDSMVRELGAHPEDNLKTEANADIQSELAKTREESRADRRHELMTGAAKAFDNPTTRAGFRENDLREAADQFNKKNGRPPIETAHVPEDPRSGAVADAYKNAVHAPNDPAVAASYDALKRDIKDQYHLMQQLGIKTDVKPENPYGLNSAVPAHQELHNDIRNNKHLSVWSGGEPPADHPLSAIDPETGHTYNSLFRMVHDTFGHAAERTDFTPGGEESAWNLHRQMFSPEARPALATETKGQAAYTYKYGDFPPQKAALLPEEFQRPGRVQQTLKQPEVVKSIADRNQQIKDGVKALHFDKTVDNYKNGYKIFDKGEASPTDVEENHGFLLGDGSILASQSKEGDNYPKSHGSIADELGPAKLKNAGAIRIAGPSTYEIYGRPTNEQLSEIGRLVKEDANSNGNDRKVVWDFHDGSDNINPDPLQRMRGNFIDSGEGSVGSFRRAVDKAYPNNPLEAVADRMNTEPAGGVDPRTGKSDTTGIGTEIYPEANQQLDHQPTAADVQKFYDTNKALFDKHPELRLGWSHEPKGWELNIGAVGDNAPEVAKKLDQRAAFDIGKGEEIPAGGTGEARAFPNYPLEDRLADLKGEEPNLKTEANANPKSDPTKPVYMRIGDWDENNPNSTNHALGKKEKGLSVYELDKSGNPVAPQEGEWADQDLADRLKSNEPRHLVQGDLVGTGHDGEPLLANARKVDTGDDGIKTEANPKAEDSTVVSPKGSTVGLRDNPLKVKPTGESEKPSTIDVAMALNKFTKKQLPALELGKAEPQEMVDRAKSLAEDEAKYQLAQNNTGESWYTRDMGKHDEILQSMRPELQDPAKLSIFKMAEAVLSSGQKPYRNFTAAVEAWDRYHETGKFPTMNPETGKSWGPRHPEAYGMALESINKLVDQHGEQGASDWLLGDHTVRELREYNRHVSGKADDVQPGVMILGPKRGPFAQNLHGKESAFTADMWVARTWNRWMGTTELAPDGELATDTPRSGKERSLMKQSFQETAAKLGKSTSSLQAILWYYEQALYDAHGSSKESWNFADAAQRAKDNEDSSFKFGANEPLTGIKDSGTMDSLSGKP